MKTLPILLACLVIAACTTEKENPVVKERVCTIKIRPELQTKSSYNADENIIRDFNAFIYKDGALISHLYSDEGKDVEGDFTPGDGYSVYMLANTGRIATPPKEEASMCCFSIKPDYGIFPEKGIPMSAFKKGLTLKDGENEICFNMERLVAKIGLRVDRSREEDATHIIRSVGVRQAFNSIFPFQSSSKATSSSMMGDGDIASKGDISKMNSGKDETIWLYVPENCQGDLLKGNTDPWKKVPDNIPQAKDVCTYIEILATYKSPKEGTQDITFRFFPGKDITGNFDIERNSASIITFVPSDKSITYDGWKVDYEKINLGINFLSRSEELQPGQIATLFLADPDGNADVFTSASVSDESILNCEEFLTKVNGKSVKVVNVTALKGGNCSLTIKSSKGKEFTYEFTSYPLAIGFAAADDTSLDWGRGAEIKPVLFNKDYEEVEDIFEFVDDFDALNNALSHIYLSDISTDPAISSVLTRKNFDLNLNLEYGLSEVILNDFPAGLNSALDNLTATKGTAGILSRDIDFVFDTDDEAFVTYMPFSRDAYCNFKWLNKEGMTAGTIHDYMLLRQKRLDESVKAQANGTFKIPFLSSGSVKIEGIPDFLNFTVTRDKMKYSVLSGGTHEGGSINTRLVITNRPSGKTMTVQSGNINVYVHAAVGGYLTTDVSQCLYYRDELDDRVEEYADYATVAAKLIGDLSHCPQLKRTSVSVTTDAKYSEPRGNYYKSESQYEGPNPNRPEAMGHGLNTPLYIYYDKSPTSGKPDNVAYMKSHRPRLTVSGISNPYIVVSHLAEISSASFGWEYLYALP